MKERLLRTKNLTLPMAIDICKTSESAKEQLRVMETATAGKEEMARDSCEPQLMQADAVAMGHSRSVKERFPYQRNVLFPTERKAYRPVPGIGSEYRRQVTRMYFVV